MCFFLAVLGLGCCAGFSPVAENGGFSFGGFSCCRAQALGCVGFFSFGSWALERMLSSCITWAWLIHGM